jgi:hypothetical protein
MSAEQKACFFKTLLFITLENKMISKQALNLLTHFVSQEDKLLLAEHTTAPLIKIVV